MGMKRYLKDLFQFSGVDSTKALISKTAKWHQKHVFE